MTYCINCVPNERRSVRFYSTILNTFALAYFTFSIIAAPCVDVRAQTSTIACQICFHNNSLFHFSLLRLQLQGKRDEQYMVIDKFKVTNTRELTDMNRAINQGKKKHDQLSDEVPTINPLKFSVMSKILLCVKLTLTNLYVDACSSQ